MWFIIPVYLYYIILLHVKTKGHCCEGWRDHTNLLHTMYIIHTYLYIIYCMYIDSDQIYCSSSGQLLASVSLMFDAQLSESLRCWQKLYRYSGPSYTKLVQLPKKWSQSKPLYVLLKRYKTCTLKAICIHPWGYEK